MMTSSVETRRLLDTPTAISAPPPASRALSLNESRKPGKATSSTNVDGMPYRRAMTCESGTSTPPNAADAWSLQGHVRATMN